MACRAGAPTKEFMVPALASFLETCHIPRRGVREAEQRAQGLGRGAWAVRAGCSSSQMVK